MHTAVSCGGTFCVGRYAPSTLQLHVYTSACAGNDATACTVGVIHVAGMEQKGARKGLTQPQAWHAGDVSASPERNEACELAGVTRACKPGL